jgi:hypothetical protein
MANQSDSEYVAKKIRPVVNESVLTDLVTSAVD